MFKRAATISLLILANIVLLAVTVVPHHHHGEMICFVASHCHHGHDCEDDEVCCHHNTQSSSPEHDHNGDASCCNVGDWLLPNIEPENKHQHHCFCASCDNTGNLFVAILPDLSEQVSQPVNLPFRQTPTDNSILQTCAGRIHGLRAPPFDGTQITRV